MMVSDTYMSNWTKTGPNKPDAVNPAMASRFQSGDYWNPEITGAGSLIRSVRIYMNIAKDIASLSEYTKPRNEY